MGTPQSFLLPKYPSCRVSHTVFYEKHKCECDEKHKCECDGERFRALVPLSKIEYGVCGDLIIRLSTSVFYLLKGGYRFEGGRAKEHPKPSTACR